MAAITVDVPAKVLGLVGKDMTAAVNTEYPSGVLDWRSFDAVTIEVTITESGATAGAAQLLFQPVDEQDANLGAQVVIATAIDTSVPGTAVVGIGRGVAASATGATISAGADGSRILTRGKLIIEVTTQATPGSSTADVFIRGTTR